MLTKRSSSKPNLEQLDSCRSQKATAYHQKRLSLWMMKRTSWYASVSGGKVRI